MVVDGKWWWLVWEVGEIGEVGRRWEVVSDRYLVE